LRFAKLKRSSCPRRKKNPSTPTAPPEPILRGEQEQPVVLQQDRIPRSCEATPAAATMTARASHLHALLSRALSPSLPPLPTGALHQIAGPSASQFGTAFLGRARFFSADASTVAAQGGSKAPAAATTGGDGGGDGQSGKSEQADAGKSVRGGPVSWLSFLLLLVTGGGIIVYYDREKKRHIEGRLL